MAIQLKEGETIDDFLNRRREELNIVRDSGGGMSQDLNMPQESTNYNFPTADVGEGPGVVDFLKGLVPENVRSTIGSGYDKFKEGAEARKEEFGEPIDIGPRGLATLLTPGGAGAASKAGTLLRSGVPNRVTSAKVVSKLPKVDPTVGGDIFELGVKQWNKTLGGKNPSEFGRELARIPQEHIAKFRMGMLEALQENLANMPRLTKSAQQNLLSPAGRARLRETLADMAPEEFDKLMLLIERGLWQEARNKILKWGVGLPLLAGTIGAVVRQMFK